MNRHRNLPASRANFCACFNCSGRKYPSCGGRMDSYCTDRRGVQRGTAFPLAGGFQRRAVPPLAHDFPSESLVCYTFVEQMAAGIVAQPRKVWLQLRRSGGKGCPLRGSISDRKRLAGGADMHCLPALSSAEQRYIKAPVSRCLPSYQNHHGSFPRRLSIASPSTFFVRLSLRWKWSAAPISGCSIPSVKP